MSVAPPPLRVEFEARGFVLLKGAISQPVLARLRDAVRPLQMHQAAGKTESPQRHQTCLEPKWFQHAFIDFLNVEATNRAAAEIIGVDHPSKLVGGASLLAVLLGHREEHCLRWHRDHGEKNQEKEILWQHCTKFIQTNCALYDDPSLWVVPGSHNRPSTKAELDWAANHAVGAVPLHEHKASLSGMPGARHQGRQNLACSVGSSSVCFRDTLNRRTGITTTPVLCPKPLYPPCMYVCMYVSTGSIHVPLAAGDCLMYNSMIWHAASYVPSAVRPRATLHSGWRHPQMPYRFETMRWGNLSLLGFRNLRSLSLAATTT